MMQFPDAGHLRGARTLRTVLFADLWSPSLSLGAACDLHCKAEIREWNQLRSNSPAANLVVSLQTTAPRVRSSKHKLFRPCCSMKRLFGLVPRPQGPDLEMRSGWAPFW